MGTRHPAFLPLTIWKPQPPACSAQGRKTGSRSCKEVVSRSVPCISLYHGAGVIVTPDQCHPGSSRTSAVAQMNKSPVAP